MATVELKPVSELFGMNFFVPSYQRGYRWTPEIQVKELLEDLYDFDENQNYCLQPIIVKQHGDNEWELVDGQQRLTALWLISALYYCIDRDNDPNLQREEYFLKYENKDKITNLFKEIDDFVKEGSLKQIADGHFDNKAKSIDCRNLIDSLEFISKYQYKNGEVTIPARKILTKIFDKLREQKIQIIWYVLDNNEDAIQTFTNVNANKIELTNAELIKAVLLHSCEKDGEDKVQALAHQWEEIEKGLNNDNFWEFIVNKKNYNYDTRIDYLFEIWCAEQKNNEIKENSDDRYAVFREVNEVLTSKSSDEIWSDIQEIYETLMDWYDDYFYYHTIGFLIAEDKKNVYLIKDLHRDYKQKNKTEFRKGILTKIKNKMKLDLPLEEIKNKLEDIEYSDSEKNDIRKILLLYSISMLVNANNTYERFPFALYKEETTWDIEHVNPQTPKDIPDDKEKWLSSYQKLLRIEQTDSNKEETKKIRELLKVIKHCQEKKFIDFDEVSREITQHYEIDNINSLGNLVLLDAGTNRGYKNDCFFDKRKKILEIERNNNSKGKYIPIGTKWVFLKGYEEAKSLTAWRKNDMDEYLKDMAKNIYNMLNGENK